MRTHVCCLATWIVLPALLIAGLAGCPPNSLHSLTLAVSPVDSGQVIATPAQSVYFAGTKVTLEAIPAEGYKFARWLGTDINTTVPTTELAIYEDHVVTAVFERDTGGDVVILSDSVLPSGEINVPYSYALAAEGGTPPYLWDLTTLFTTWVPGLTFTSGGTFTGTPTQTGLYTFRVRVRDSAGNAAQKYLSMMVNPEGENELQIISDQTLPEAQTALPYRFDFEAQGGTWPYTWTLVSGTETLPTGTGLTSGGTLSGVPLAAGQYTFIVRVTDTAGDWTEGTFSVNIVVPLTEEK